MLYGPYIPVAEIDTYFASENNLCLCCVLLIMSCVKTVVSSHDGASATTVENDFPLLCRD